MKSHSWITVAAVTRSKISDLCQFKDGFKDGFGSIKAVARRKNPILLFGQC